MQMNISIALLSLLISTGSFAADLNCEATTILFEGSGLKVGDKISFDATRSILTAKNISQSCVAGPKEMAAQLNASLILGCGDGNDKDLYIFNKDNNTVELMDIAVYTCK